jgi:hypothetical protein
MRKQVGRKNHKSSVRNLDPKQSLTIDDFCWLEQMCRKSFYNLDSQGRAPRTYWVGVTRRITPQAHAAWRAEREAESSQAA